MGSREKYKNIAKETIQHINEHINTNTTLGNAIIKAKQDTIEYKQEDEIQLIDTPPPNVISKDTCDCITQYEVLNESCVKTLER